MSVIAERSPRIAFSISRLVTAAVAVLLAAALAWIVEIPRWTALFVHHSRTAYWLSFYCLLFLALATVITVRPSITQKTFLLVGPVSGMVASGLAFLALAIVSRSAVFVTSLLAGMIISLAWLTGAVAFFFYSTLSRRAWRAVSWVFVGGLSIRLVLTGLHYIFNEPLI